MRTKYIFQLGKQMPQYWFARKTGFPKILPTNLTLNATYRCNSRCLTCNIWKKRTRELTLVEWKKVFKNYNSSVFWLIISGGEPFLRKDLVELVKAGYDYLQPAIINIPTNGILFKIIPQKIELILKNCSDSEIVINFSLDGVGRDHDRIRRVSGNFEKLMKSFKAVKELKKKHFNLTVGLHTVISKYNVQNIPQICDFALSQKPDQYITEIAEQRAELGIMSKAITPSLREYSKAVDYVAQKTGEMKPPKLAKVTGVLRQEYYNLVKNTLKQKTQVIPCYAGWASAQISADGEVWPCCVRGDNLGNLKDNNYNFAKIWFSKRAEKVKKSIKSKRCFCPLASASYTNMLMNLKTDRKLLFNLFKI